MESNNVLEGSQLSEQTHSIKYMHIIGDGDSSEMTTLQQQAVYGPLFKNIIPVKGTDQGC